MIRRGFWLGWLLLATSPAFPEWVVGTEVPPAARRFASGGGKFFPLARSPYALLVHSGQFTLLRREKGGAYRSLGKRAQPGPWQDEFGLSIFLLGKTPESGLAVGSRGSSIQVLVFPAGMRKPARQFDFQAPSGASAWSAPGYQLEQRRGQLVIEMYWDSMGEELPDGSHHTETSPGTLEYVWNGRQFVPPR